MTTRKIGLGGSCHWCTEAIFQSLRGVERVDQGWLSADEAAEFSEGIVVYYNPAQIALIDLIRVHVHTHSSTSRHSLRARYRSAVYVFEESQYDQAREALDELQKDFEKPLITEVLHYRAFRSSEEAFKNYYLQNPEKPFCKSYIDPKLKLLTERFSKLVKPQ